MSNSDQGYKKVREYIVKCKPKTDAQIKDYHRKRLYELSLETLGAVPWLEKPNEEQEEWVKRRMHGSARSREAFNNG